MATSRQKNLVNGATVRKPLLGAKTTEPERWEFNATSAVEFGPGVVDTDRSYLALTRSDGTKVYLYVDTGTTLAISTTKP